MQPRSDLSNSIIETNSMRDILKLITYNTCVIFDLDNTVMESFHELGSDQWFVKLIEHACQVIPNTDEAIACVVALYHAVQHHVTAKAVETNVAMLIKRLQEAGVSIVAVTARDACLVAPTLRQLKSIGIDFSYQGIDTVSEPIVKDNKLVAYYHQGIIFCSGNDKGVCFEAYAKQYGCHVQSMLVIDDKEKHLRALQKTAKSMGVLSFKGVRYGYLDQKVSELDMQAAHIQLHYLKPTLPAAVHPHIEKLQIPACDLTVANTSHFRFFTMPEVRSEQSSGLRVVPQ
jgi:hypothetical protein